MSSNLYGKLETDVEIKASSTQFHHMFRHKPHHISNASSDKVQACNLHEGDWGTVGAVISWNYFHGKHGLLHLCLSLVFLFFFFFLAFAPLLFFSILYFTLFFFLTICPKTFIFFSLVLF